MTEQLTIDQKREQVAEAYLDLLDSTNSRLAVLANEIGMNAARDNAKKFLLGQQEEQSVWKTMGDNLKTNLLKKITDNQGLEYQTAALQTMQDKILKASDTDLDALLTMIKDGKDPVTNTPVVTPTTNSSQPTPAPTAGNTTELSTAYGELKLGDGITQEIINYVNDNAKYIVEHLTIKGEFAKIDDIKDRHGETILKCRGESPYINKKAVSDLIGLSLVFHKNTGKEFLLESAYRTIEHQQRLVVKNKPSGIPTAEPGYSGHNMGFSIDVSTDTRYSGINGGVSGLQKIAKKFNFNPISSEDRHFDYTEFVDKYYKDKDARLPVAQKMDKDFNDLGLTNNAGAA